VLAAWSIPGSEIDGYTAMRENGEQAWDGGDLQQEVQVENVEDHRADRHHGSIIISLHHTDVSSFVSLGPWNVSSTPEQLFEACEKNLPAFLRAMEARIPEARRSSFSSDDFWSAVLGEGLAIEVVVRDREDGG